MALSRRSSSVQTASSFSAGHAVWGDQTAPEAAFARSSLSLAMRLERYMG